MSTAILESDRSAIFLAEEDNGLAENQAREWRPPDFCASGSNVPIIAKEHGQSLLSLASNFVGTSRTTLARQLMNNVPFGIKLQPHKCGIYGETQGRVLRICFMRNQDHKPKKFDLHGYVPYLVRRISDVLIERFTDGLKPYELTLFQWRILAVLYRRGATRFRVLVGQTLIEPPTVSRLVAELQAKGYVTKTSSEVDARGVLISPTRKALDLVERLTPHALEVEKETLSGLTEDEAEIFRRLVRRVCAHLAPFVPDDEGRD